MTNRIVEMDLASKRLEKLVEDRGFDGPQAISKRSGVPRTTIHSWIKENPRLCGAKAESIWRVAKALGVPTGILGYLFEGKFDDGHSSKPSQQQVSLPINLTNNTYELRPDILRESLRKVFTPLAHKQAPIDLELLVERVTCQYLKSESSSKALPDKEKNTPKNKIP
ncbi:hypothetical protein ACL7TT_11650 [Microbulbifer sp. 2304DJ12-6]|uniref:hypothetical protein n=1 Tax=Microbulbifer sp. 2304DJ12-6 TaxID=3233340 RepID=UPI0039B06B50